jgi:hypothetical protein
MAFTLKELAQNPSLLRDLRARCNESKPLCGNGCGQALNFSSGRNPMKKNGKDILACDDCFYDELGKLVEEHPIPSAGFRRS